MQRRTHLLALLLVLALVLAACPAPAQPAAAPAEAPAAEAAATKAPAAEAEATKAPAAEPADMSGKVVIAPGQTIRIADRGPVGQVTLRGDLASKALKAAVRAGVGVDVPGVRQAAFAGGKGAVWMSPDELLLFCGYDEAGALVAALDEALAGEHHLAVDVSDARVVIALSGAGVPEVLAKGAPVDLSDAASPVGAARRTHVAGIAACTTSGAMSGNATAASVAGRASANTAGMRRHAGR